MPYELPTVEQFTDRFRQFRNTDEYFIAMMIGEASTYVDDSWNENDYQPAIMYLVAHWMTIEAGGATGAQSGGMVAGPIVSESFGPISRSYANIQQSGASSSDPFWTLSMYGRRFVQLRDRNFLGPMVV
jgi:hypothetical protein